MTSVKQIQNWCREFRVLANGTQDKICIGNTRGCWKSNNMKNGSKRKNENKAKENCTCFKRGKECHIAKNCWSHDEKGRNKDH